MTKKFKRIIEGGVQAKEQETRAQKEGSASKGSAGALRSSLVGPFVSGGRNEVEDARGSARVSFELLGR
jgi:hypothetical protein